jgi:hypothetical protein
VAFDSLKAQDQVWLVGSSQRFSPNPSAGLFLALQRTGLESQRSKPLLEG